MKFQTYYGVAYSFRPAHVIVADNYQHALAKCKSVEPYLFLKEELNEQFNIQVEEPDNQGIN